MPLRLPCGNLDLRGCCFWYTEDSWQDRQSSLMSGYLEVMYLWGWWEPAIMNMIKIIVNDINFCA